MLLYDNFSPPLGAAGPICLEGPWASEESEVNFSKPHGMRELQTALNTVTTSEYGQWALGAAVPKCVFFNLIRIHLEEIYM